MREGLLAGALMVQMLMSAYQMAWFGGRDRERRNAPTGVTGQVHVMDDPWPPPPPH